MKVSSDLLTGNLLQLRLAKISLTVHLSLLIGANKAKWIFLQGIRIYRSSFLFLIAHSFFNLSDYSFVTSFFYWMSYSSYNLPNNFLWTTILCIFIKLPHSKKTLSFPTLSSQRCLLHALLNLVISLVLI